MTNPVAPVSGLEKHLTNTLFDAEGNPQLLKRTVAPVEGHYARMRDGAVVGPIRNASAWYTNSTDKWGCWHTDFLWDNTGRLSGKAYDPDLDIIATISPADMQAVASGELERLRAALKPFADVAKVAHMGVNTRSHLSDDAVVHEWIDGGQSFQLTVGDFRRARTASEGGTV